MILPKFQGMTAVIIGTGPSLTPLQLELISVARFSQRRPIRVFGVNNVYQHFTNLDVHYACNREWWDHYYPKDPMLQESVQDGYTAHWTHDLQTARRYGPNYIEGRWSGGKRRVTSLSTDPNYIHYGHGSGYEVLGLAYHYGCRRFVLCGYDLRYPSGYDPVAKNPGGNRHFFGEYPEALQHWPGSGGRNVAPDGSITGLLDCYRTIDCDKLRLTIVNCSPGSALDFFEVGELEKELDLENYQPHVSVDDADHMGVAGRRHQITAGH